MTRRIASAFLSASLACTAPAFAWGDRGHYIINHAAAQTLPKSLPAFVRTASAQYEISELGFELDRLKGSGSAWDAENDPGHYIDLNDDGSLPGGIMLQALPPTQEAYDTALRAAGSDQYRMGYSPYAILEGWQQLRDDFAYWRVDDYHTLHAATKALRAEAARDRTVDEAVTLRDIGVWSHYVGDAAQPLHVSVHFNGWGKFPNPNNYTQSYRTHSMFESTFVQKYVTEAMVRQDLRPPAVTPPSALVTDAQAMQAIASYINASLQQVIPLYEIEKAGGFANGTPQAKAFTAARLAAAADELRDLVLWAWDDSLNQRVGYPYQSVRDILSGKPPPKGTPGD